MKDVKIYTLAFLHSKISFFIEKPLSMVHIFDFFSTHFMMSEGAEEDVLARIIVTRNSALFEGVDFTAGEDIYLRKSASEFFTIPAKSVVLGGVQYLRCAKMFLALNTAEKTITVSTQGDDLKAEELVIIELIRDLILKNEENHGVVVLHATCAYRDGLATLIIGPKGAGKSTTLLELVSKFDYLFMSGDKTFLWVEDGQLLASGWPDYPHLGLGTLSKYPKFISAFELSEQITAAQGDLWSTEHKRAISPQTFKAMIPHVPTGLIATVGCFLYPRLEPSEDCLLVPVVEHIFQMEPHIERIFEKDKVQWNAFIEPQNLDAIDRMIEHFKQFTSVLPAFELIGSGILSSVATMHTGVVSSE
jgi:hypothetical protein